MKITAPLWARILLGIMSLMVIGLTIPAFINPGANPALAELPPEFAVFASIGGGFLVRQLAIALIGLFSAIQGNPMAVGVSAAAFMIWNLLEAVFIFIGRGMGPGPVLGGLFAVLGAVIIWAAYSKVKKSV